jgi:hypothetical protein
MRSITAVEIGADICALARTSVSGGNVHLWAAETLDPGAFPGVEAFTLAVRRARHALKLPRRCRAVVWGLPDGASRRDPIVGPLIEPLTKAGFKVSRVVTPCNALGALARLRTSRTGGAMCWLGINRNGVAIVIVRPGKLLYSHSFAWDSNVGASGSQARLLQRYSLVAFLAPEVRRGIAAARQKGTTVDGIVTCGNLPDLRSLTMPLIEELDIEVETLDSLEGLVVQSDAADRLSEAASSIRLACAGTIARETRSLDEGRRRRVRWTARVAALLPAAAVVAAGGAIGYWYYARSRAVHPAPAPHQTPAPKMSSTAPVAKTTSPSTVTAPPPAQPVAQVPPPQAPIPPAPAAIPPEGGRYRREGPVAPPSALPPPSSAPSALEGRPSSAPVGTLSPLPPPADKVIATRPGPDSSRPMPERLKDPVPRVTAILMSADRRLATIGDEGQIIGVGDTIGRRVVVGIDDRTVLLREPSGVQIRVGLGGRVVGVERGDR